MIPLYIVLYSPFHDNDYFSKDVFTSLENASQAIEAQTHDFYEYESVLILEISDWVTIKKRYEINEDNQLIISEWDENPYRFAVHNER